MKVIITKHAIKRIKQRINDLEYPAIVKMANIAWRSKQEISKWFLESKHNLQKEGFSTYHYRQLGDSVFVFQYQNDSTLPILITVYTKKNEGSLRIRPTNNVWRRYRALRALQATD